MNSENPVHLKALVAEDEPAMLSLVARHMRSLGFDVVEAGDGDAAWDLAQKHHPDLVLLDVMMPGMSGWEICKRLKGDTHEGRPFAKTGVIMLTGIGENLNEMTSPLFAADAWLNKPFEFTELDKRVIETLERYGKERAAAAAQAYEAEEAAPKKAAAAKAPAKKAPEKEAPVKKAPAAKAPAKKAPVAKKAPEKKAPAKKAPPAKAPEKKAPAKKEAAKKSPAKKPAKKVVSAKKPAAKTTSARRSK